MNRMEGSCKYCGQIINVEADTQTEADERATMECIKNGAAKLAQKRISRTTKGNIKVTRTDRQQQSHETAE